MSRFVPHSVLLHVSAGPTRVTCAKCATWQVPPAVPGWKVGATSPTRASQPASEIRAANPASTASSPEPWSIPPCASPPYPYHVRQERRPQRRRRRRPLARPSDPAPLSCGSLASFVVATPPLVRFRCHLPPAAYLLRLRHVPTAPGALVCVHVCVSTPAVMVCRARLRRCRLISCYSPSARKPT